MSLHAVFKGLVVRFFKLSKKQCALALFSWLVSAPLLLGAAQASQLSVIGQQYEIRSAVLQEDRLVLVSLPVDYAFSQVRYPILYVLDGERSFSHIAPLARFLGEAGRIPKMIVVGIINTDRNRDFAPPLLQTSDVKQQQLTGARQFTDFLKTELMPWVDLRYRTLPWRALHGHSLGGLMNFYMLVHEPDLFQAHIAASPSLWWDQQAYVSRSKNALSKKGMLNKTWLFFATGAYEPEISAANKDVAAWLTEQNHTQTNTQINNKVTWRYQYYQTSDHASTSHRTALDGLEFIFSNWPLIADDKTREARVNLIAEHQQSLQSEYGFAASLSALDVIAYAVHRLRADEFEAVQQTLKEWQAMYPKHPFGSFLYAELAILYAKKDMPTQALSAYHMAQRLKPQAMGHDDGRYLRVEAELKRSLHHLLKP